MDWDGGRATKPATTLEEGTQHNLHDENNTIDTYILAHPLVKAPLANKYLYMCAHDNLMPGIYMHYE